ncbi:uncharacterized protein I303_100542 [Kwoniella dejecticola CBS 10117]|uniref:Uncharacterized protein n=1 Tax=Kwoniella dejecticola CBS 10117 TaxID=1296121 RepID=A0A1A6AF91_9TREE|nr:uncharacterized protein I303_00543 [Kwoniella dejecticola CBS 10117]OBR88726.1 hypothetical protein I303_00543 [Kwoniella dejecticola CBS 10117]
MALSSQSMQTTADSIFDSTKVVTVIGWGSDHPETSGLGKPSDFCISYTKTSDRRFMGLQSGYQPIWLTRTSRRHGATDMHMVEGSEGTTIVDQPLAGDHYEEGIIGKTERDTHRHSRCSVRVRDRWEIIPEGQNAETVGKMLEQLYQERLEGLKEGRSTFQKSRSDDNAENSEVEAKNEDARINEELSIWWRVWIASRGKDCSSGPADGEGV